VTILASAWCGRYELIAQREGSLHDRGDGTLELTAEDRYLVRLPAGVLQHELRGALTAFKGATEGVLHFGNYIGEASLDGRGLVVGSSRLDPPAVATMLDEVAAQLGSLPFTDESPTSAPYVRERALTPDALYHAFVFLRDGMEGRGRHAVPPAMSRILARPHETFEAGVARLVPLGQVSRIDSATLTAIAAEPELLVRVPQDSPLIGSSLASRLDGRFPGFLRERPLDHTTDNRENRFVVAALQLMRDVALQFERAARMGRRPSSEINRRDAIALAAQIDRWRRHATLTSLGPARDVSLQSTVLRGRTGYRELLRFYLELVARTQFTAPHDLRNVLELRHAADIYELWCFFAVVKAVAATLDAAPELTRFSFGTHAAKVPWGYRAGWPGVDVFFNRSYSRPGAGGTPQAGAHSYSLRLRPDITLLQASGTLDVFDAKFKLSVSAAFDAQEETVDAAADTFKPDDIHKMHAYRDALGARSAWVLYPGVETVVKQFPAPCSASVASFTGVGAIPLRPGPSLAQALSTQVASLLVVR